MALKIKNAAVETLVNEDVALTGESKTEAIKQALQDRMHKLRLKHAFPQEAQLRCLLEEDIWPSIPKHQLGKGVSQEDQDALLRYGPEGL